MLLITRFIDLFIWSTKWDIYILLQNMQQTMYGSANYDLEMLKYFILVKRLSFESKFHDVSAKDVVFVQLSSSKLYK